jgi:spore coat protein CotF
MDEVSTQESWNKKRIFAAVFLITILIAGVYLFKTRIINTSLSSQDSTSVKGVSSEKEKAKEDLSIEIQGAIKERINNLKQEVSSLNVVEVASSSPQVQKILNDIKSLEQYPVNQAKEICRQICGL